jgi:hypothetical protein
MITRLRLVFVLSASILTLVACGSSEDDTSVRAQAIEPILDGQIDVTADPSGTAATLVVDTTIPVACSVIYGIDDSFGSIAVDNDMQGGAHEDHGPLLTGLTPDTEYQYILQGSDAAGTIYRSELKTFTTPLAAEAGFGPNIATEGTVSDFSSEFSEEFAVANAIDGDLATEWSTDGDGNSAWLEIDLREPRQITGVAFRTRQMTDGTATTQTFTVTTDDGRTLGPYPAGTGVATLEEAPTTRTVRVDADETTGGNTGATEIEIYTG